MLSSLGRNLARTSAKAATSSMGATTVVARRQFSDEVRGIKEAPIRLHGLSGRYAHGLFGAALGKSSPKAVETELNEFLEMAAEEGPLNRLLKDQFVPRSLKKDTIAQVMKACEFSPTLTNFMVTLAENSRLEDLNEIADAYFNLVNATSGSVEVVVTTAEPMTYRQQTEIRRSIMKDYLPGTTDVQMNLEVDEAIGGGYVLDFAGKRIDCSVARRLDQIRRLVTDLEAAGRADPHPPAASHKYTSAEWDAIDANHAKWANHIESHYPQLKWTPREPQLNIPDVVAKAKNSDDLPDAATLRSKGWGPSTPAKKADTAAIARERKEWLKQARSDMTV